MGNWTYQLIEELRDKKTWSSLDRFFRDTLGVSLTDEAQIRQFRDLLFELEQDRLLLWKAGRPIINKDGVKDFDWDIFTIYDPIECTHKRMLGQLDNGIIQTFGNNRIEAKLTFKGLDYAFKVHRDGEFHKSSMETNKSFKYANWWMPRLTGALILASLSPIAIEIVKNTQSQKPLKEFQAQLQKLDSVQQIHQNKMDSLLKKKNQPIYPALVAPR